MKLAFEILILLSVEVSLSGHRHEFLIFQLELQLKFDDLTVQIDVIGRMILWSNLYLLSLLLCRIRDEL
jgi:hypothetical protein